MSSWKSSCLCLGFIIVIHHLFLSLLSHLDLNRTQNSQSQIDRTLPELQLNTLDQLMMQSLKIGEAEKRSFSNRPIDALAKPLAAASPCAVNSQGSRVTNWSPWRPHHFVHQRWKLASPSARNAVWNQALYVFYIVLLHVYASWKVFFNQTVRCFGTRKEAPHTSTAITAFLILSFIKVHFV